MNRERVRDAVVRFAFGDRVGLAVFLASLCLFGACWRAGFLITDTYTLANGLAAVEQGRLYLTAAPYSEGTATPGVYHVDGRLYPRNFGVLIAALPFLWALQALAAVTELRIGLVAVWSLLVLATAVVAGRAVDRERQFALAGGGVALAAFAVNVALATPMDPPLHQLALQALHAVVAAFVAVFAYRLLADRYRRRYAVVGAVAVVLGTPLAAWATVPKRHVITAAVALALAYALRRSRAADGALALEARAVGYVAAGLLAWVHAPEALAIFVPFVAVDVATAPANDRRTVATVGAAFAASLLPFAVTNVLVGGHPLRVPRMLPGATQADARTVADDGSGTAGAATPGGDGSAATPIDEASEIASPDQALREGLDFAATAVEPLTTFGRFLLVGVEKLLGSPAAAFHTFVRSGHVERVAERSTGAATADLSMLESTALLAVVAAAVPAAVVTLRGVRDRRDLIAAAGDVEPDDAYLALAAAALILLYLPRLPLHAQLTVRYLFPVYPIAVYLGLRLSPIRDALATHWRTYCWTLAAALLVGGQLLVVALVWLSPTLGEALQLHGLLSLAAAAPLGLWSVSGGYGKRASRAGAVLLALATATAALLVAGVVVEYYTHGNAHVLPAVRALAETVSVT
ncbi:hypothetical protein [Halomicrobium salinisoli]|uniref:hypothetical protein n=1 Tax=Halomicrobium salinisoli TaxID=2878391 RepID=UPI001CF0B440|nr:hypothetical protein [Halomicrobium salinisoli]